jgi:hypothetical protein
VQSIKLTQGQRAIIDDCDADLMQRKWCYHKCGSDLGYATRTEKGVTIRLHQIVAGRIGIFGHIDHKDGNTLNNTRANLRSGSGSRNNQNRRICQGTSKYKGVSFCNREGKWRSYIRLPIRQFKSLGYYSSEKEAAKAYNIAAQKYFGEYAVLNEV